MKVNIYFFALVLISAIGGQAQTIMNIHQSNGIVLQIPLNTIDSITYTIPNAGNLATLSTTAVSSNEKTTAIFGGNIITNGESLITQCGVCYGISPSPTTANTKVVSESSTNIFSCTVIGLIENTTYYVRAFATNSAGTAYGNELIFTTTTAGGGIVTNPGAGVTFDGYTYGSIVLGNGQEWMEENLRTTTYANGDPIPNVTNSTQWNNLTTGAWVYFINDYQLENPFGKLYNWYTVNDSRNLCPLGWHVPSDAEWSIFIDYLDPIAEGGNNVVNEAGSKMRSTGTQYWDVPNTDATNESGFSALGGGYRLGTIGFSEWYGMGYLGYWWSSTAHDESNALLRNLYESYGVMKDSYIKTSGLSVRCLRD